MDLDLRQSVLDQMISQTQKRQIKYQILNNQQLSLPKSLTVTQLYNSLISQRLTIQDVNLIHLAATELKQKKQSEYWNTYHSQVIQRPNSVFQYKPNYKLQPHVITMPKQRVQVYVNQYQLDGCNHHTYFKPQNISPQVQLKKHNSANLQ